jgi:diguanylate cyclase (GGDEF)-like protein
MPTAGTHAPPIERPLQPSAHVIAAATATAVGLAALWTFGLPALGLRVAPATAELVQGLCNTLLQTLAALALLRGASRQTGRRRAAWMTMAAGAAAGALGSIHWSWILAVTRQHPNSPVVDVLYATALFLTTIGLAMLPPSEARSRRVRVVDTAILVLTALTLVWVTPVHQQVDGRLIAGFPTISLYGIITVLTILVAVGAFARSRPDRQGEVGLMAGAITCSGLGMLLYASSPADYPTTSRLADVLFCFGFCLAIAAGLRLCGPSRAMQRRGSDASRHWVALPEVATVVTLVANAVHARFDDNTAVSLIVGTSAVALAVTRMLQLAIEQRGLSRTLHDSADLLYREARTDTLTSLGNRLALDEHLRTTLEHQARLRPDDRSPVTVVFVDVDHFKRFNDALGHAVGDGLLSEVARRIVTVLGQHAYRIGGDEFVAVVDGLSAAAAEEAAAELLRAFDESVVVADHEMHAAVSVGVARWGDGELALVPTAAELVGRADLALYRAKELGRGQWAAFDPALAAQATQRHDLRHGLQQAAESEELEVHFEPVACLRDHRVVGVTASLHWRSEAFGLLGPEIIGPVAVEGGLVAANATELFAGIRRALADTTDVQTDPSGTPLWIGTRLTREELLHPAVGELVLSCLDLPGMVPSRLRIDVTEDTPADEQALEVMAGLRQLGVHLTVEQFGTGPSSLMRLSSYPASTIRVDRSFVEGLGRRRDDTVIITTVAGLGADLGLELSADGVDEEFQATYLEGLGFSSARGRLFGEASPRLELLDDGRSLAVPTGAPS